MKINLVSLFSGYDSQALSMERLKRDYPDKFDYELVAWCEIDKAACMAHDTLFPQWEDRNLGDISKVKAEDIPDCDCMTWSFPCTDISGAGKQMGLSKNSGTRSSLAWEAIRCFKEKRPKYLLMENVAALAQKKFIKDFHALQYELEQMGYTNFCAILDSAKFGVPQHRERLFMISILDCDRSYHFPEPFKLEKRIKDILEPYGTVDESFYFKPEQLLRIIAHCDRKDKESDIEIFGRVNSSQDGIVVTEDSVSPCHCVGHGNMPKVAERIKEGISIHPLNRKMEFKGYGSIQSDTEPCLTAHDGKDSPPVLWQRLSLYGSNAQAGRVYDVEGIAPTVKCQTGGNSEPKILEPVAAGISVHPLSHKFEFSGMESVKEISPTLRATDYKCPHCLWEKHDVRLEDLPDKTVLKDEDGKGYLWQDGSLWRVRKLVPIEVFRLQDVSDEDAKKIIAVCSKTACYQLAGNSITCAVLYHIFRKLWIDTEIESAQKSLFDF